jgi:hypothetical protein
MVNCIDLEESTTDTSGDSASEISNSSITEVVGVNDDDEYEDEREYYSHLANNITNK